MKPARSRLHRESFKRCNVKCRIILAQLEQAGILSCAVCHSHINLCLFDISSSGYADVISPDLGTLRRLRQLAEIGCLGRLCYKCYREHWTKFPCLLRLVPIKFSVVQGKRYLASQV